jgi:hypothetical protein
MPTNLNTFLFLSLYRWILIREVGGDYPQASQFHSQVVWHHTNRDTLVEMLLDQKNKKKQKPKPKKEVEKKRKPRTSIPMESTWIESWFTLYPIAKVHCTMTNIEELLPHFKGRIYDLETYVLKNYVY